MAHQQESRGELPRWAVAVIHVLFFLSGAAALIYEVVWMRMLSFVFGNTTYAVSVVLATFLGGLAIGAWRFGRKADKGGGLLRTYAGLEAGAALIALALPFLLLEVLTPAYTWVYQRAGESLAALTAVRLLLSGALLVTPAILLGGTLPVLVRFLVRREEGMDAHIGRLYGLNTLGAVAGSFAAGFLLLPSLGLRTSNFAAAGLGLLVSVAAVTIHWSLGGRSAVSPRWRPTAYREPDDHAPRPIGGWLLAAFALSGFAALSYEVLWTRLLVFFFDGTVFAFSSMLCVYLLGLGVGSLIHSRYISRSRRQVRWFVILEVATGAAGAASLLVFLIVPRLRFAQLVSGFWGEVIWILVVAGTVMIVPTILLGALFPLVSAMWARSTGRVGGGVGEVYVVNTLGTVAGSLATGFLLIPAIGTPASLFLAASLNVGAGLIVWAAASPSRRGLRGIAAVAVPLAAAFALSHIVTGSDMVRAIRRGRNAEIEWVHEGKDGTVTIERVHPIQKALAGPGDPRVITINGINVAGTLFDLQTTQRLQAHLAMLIHPNPRTVMHIGFGSGGTAYSLTQHPVERIDAVEISDAVIQAAPKLPETNRGVLSDPRVRVYLEDARTFAKHTPRHYDLILSDLAHPTLAGQGFFYSVDYLEDCRARLAPGGFFSTWTPVHGLRLQDLKVLVRSIKHVFPYLYIWHSAGGRNEFCVIHGMSEPLRIDYTSFASRMAVPGVTDDLAWIGIRRPEEALALMLYDDKAIVRWLGDGDLINTDDNGYLEFVAARGLRDMPVSRRAAILETYPSFVTNAGGSVVDYVEGGPASSASWRDEMGRHAEANRHVLWGRLYEQARGDFYHLLAAHQYRRALEIVPEHFVARSLLGITERQLEVARRDAEVPNAPVRSVEEWLGALIAARRLDEAAEWAELNGRHEDWGPTFTALLGVLREGPDQVKRVLAGASGGTGAPAAIQLERAPLEAAVAAQELAAKRPDDPAVWLSLGDSYTDLAQAIGRRTFRPLIATQNELIGLLHSISIQATATLQEMAAASYQKASFLAADPATAEYRLSRALAAMGHYGEAARILRQIEGAPLDRQGNEVSADSLRATGVSLQELAHDRFGFLQVVREEITKPRQESTRLWGVTLPEE